VSLNNFVNICVDIAGPGVGLFTWTCHHCIHIRQGSSRLADCDQHPGLDSSLHQYTSKNSAGYFIDREISEISCNNTGAWKAKQRKSDGTTYVVHAITVTTKACDDGIANHGKAWPLQDLTTNEVLRRIVGGWPLN
jgi:hypothetical protein